MSEPRCHLCNANSSETSPFLVQLSTASAYPGTTVHAWLHLRARACPACLPQIRALTVRRRIGMAMFVGAAAALIAFFDALSRHGGGLALLVWGALFLALTVAPFVLIGRAESRIIEGLRGRAELRQVLDSIPAGGLRSRNLRIFGDVGAKAMPDLDDFLRERGLAPRESARERLNRR